MRTRAVTILIALLVAMGIIAAGATAASAGHMHDDGLAHSTVAIL
jgi:hypothetical protein